MPWSFSKSFLISAPCPPRPVAETRSSKPGLNVEKFQQCKKLFRRYKGRDKRDSVTLAMGVLGYIGSVELTSSTSKVWMSQSGPMKCGFFCYTNSTSIVASCRRNQIDSNQIVNDQKAFWSWGFMKIWEWIVPHCSSSTCEKETQSRRHPSVGKPIIQDFPCPSTTDVTIIDHKWLSWFIEE